MSEKKRPWWQYLLAVVGAGYLVAGAAWGVYALVKRPAGPRGPSEIAAHPERAGEILARERAEEMRQRLGLSGEQTAKVAEVLKAGAEAPPGPESMRAVMEKVREALTPEQRERMGGGPGALGPPPGMRGGPGGGTGRRVSPERLEALKEHMTPEQQQKFDAGMKRMQERRNAMRGRFGGGPGGGRGPGGMPPGGGPPPGEGPPPPPMP